MPDRLPHTARPHAWMNHGVRAPDADRDARLGDLRRAVSSVAVGELVYAVPDSVNEPIIGAVVDTDGVALALDTDDNGIVWVHGADCPDLARAAARD